METATAIEKLDDLITNSQSEDSRKLFPLDQPEATVEIEIVDEDFNLTLAHRIKWPTLGALIEREKQIPQETEVLNATENKLQGADAVTANARLWDQFAVAVHGYEMAGVEVAPDVWLDVTPGLAYEIPSEHKSEAIVGLHAAKFEIERPKNKGFVLGATVYRVKQIYGPYEIWHVFNRPSEKDRREFARKSRETHYRPGSAKIKTLIFTNLKVYADLYDKLFLGLEGVGGDAANITTRKDLVNGLWKRGAIDALMSAFDASRRD